MQDKMVALSVAIRCKVLEGDEMSYCRFSTDNWRCEVYAYNTDMGYEIWVAARRWPEGVPVPDPSNLAGAEGWSAGLVSIGGPLDGAHFLEPTATAFLARMVEIREAGYKFPDYVLEDILKEIGEGD